MDWLIETFAELGRHSRTTPDGRALPYVPGLSRELGNIGDEPTETRRRDDLTEPSDRSMSRRILALD